MKKTKNTCLNINCPEHTGGECTATDLSQKIGFLRQWLNEDRITDPKKMVTNEMIEKWLA